MTTQPVQVLMSHTMHVSYLQIAERSRQAAQSTQNKIDTFNSIPETEKTEETYKAIGPIYYELHQHCVTAIVFSALGVEAYINHYILSNCSETQFKKYYDRFDVKQKILFAPKLLKNVTIDFSRHEVAHLDELIKWRNELVHFKGGVNLTPAQLAKELLPLHGNAKKSVDYAIEVIVMVADQDRESIKTLFGF